MIPVAREQGSAQVSRPQNWRSEPCALQLICSASCSPAASEAVLSGAAGGLEAGVSLSPSPVPVHVDFRVAWVWAMKATYV